MIFATFCRSQLSFPTSSSTSPNAFFQKPKLNSSLLPSTSTSSRLSISATLPVSFRRNRKNARERLRLSASLAPSTQPAFRFAGRAHLTWSFNYSAVTIVGIGLRCRLLPSRKNEALYTLLFKLIYLI